MKYKTITKLSHSFHVALFTRAWIEISLFENKASWNNVALFTRAWIEIESVYLRDNEAFVALFTRAWIEISSAKDDVKKVFSRPFHEGVD